MSEVTTQDFKESVNLQDFVPNVKFELIPIKNLVSNQQYQRSLSTAHVEKTAENFDLYQINPVKVSRRNGQNYVFNGQHTIETVARVSGSRDTPVWCMVYDDLEYQAEADIFANQMRYTKQLTPYEIFNANIEAGNELQLTIKKMVESYGLKLYSTVKQNTICAISALEFIFKKYGFHTLDKTLYLIVATWEGEPFSLSANIIKGAAKLIYTYGDSLNIDSFVERLSRISPKEIIRNGRERNNGSLGFAEALLVYYNKRVKYPLRRDMLYTGKKRIKFLAEMGMGGDEHDESSNYTMDEGFISPEDIEQVDTSTEEDEFDDMN